MTDRTLTLALFGSTSGVGRLVLDQALAAGHRVRALARRPEALAATAAHVVAGDVLDAAAVDATLDGADVVVVCLGAPAGSKARIRERGTALIVQRMHARGLRRIVALSVLGVGDSYPTLRWLEKFLVFPLYLQRAVDDHAEQERVLASSGLDWTALRPPHMSDEAGTGAPAVGFAGDEPLPNYTVARADVAQALLQTAVAGSWSGRAVGVTAPVAA
jgi:uncharacterized protein YbjT (DUF2867 family)